MENTTERFLLCDANENFYTINKLLYDILAEYKITNSYATTCRNLNSRRTDNFFNEEFIEKSVGKALLIMNKDSVEKYKKGMYIRNKFAIIKEGSGLWLFKLLGILFNGYIFAILSAFAITITLFFFYEGGLTNIRAIYAKVIASLTMQNIAICYVIFLIVIIIHEVGHATATYRFGIKPKEIGAGLYFIFPVLYTNVTNIWTLDAGKRSIVNLAGIYFQLLLNILFIGLLSFNVYSNIVLILLVSNTSSIIVSFNPFFRYDGYWVFSDSFKILNLKKASGDFIATWIFKPSNIKNYITSKKIPFALIVYSICDALFWIWVYIVIIKYLFIGIHELFFSFSSIKLEGQGSIFSIGLKILTLCWLLLMLIGSFIKLKKFLNHGKLKRVY